MYLEPFKLNELPFRLSPDPQFLFLSKQHSRAKAYMQSAVWFTDGFVVISGDIGSGKTTLIEAFLKELPPDVVVAQVNQTQVSSIGFLQCVLVQFGFSPFRMKKAELLATINNFLIEQFTAGRKVLLIIDEAQNLSLRVLEEIRMLSGVESTKEKVLRIILAGQPELNKKLAAPQLVQLAQRIRLRFHLTALSLDEMREYIQHRLTVAGAGERPLFAPEVFPEIFRYTAGVPRLVNTLCDTALMAAYAADHDSVTLADLRSAVSELQWVVKPRLPPVAVPLSLASDSMRPSGADSMPARALGAEPAPAPLRRVLVRTDGRTVRELPLRPGRLVIGRTTDNDVQIDSRFVSRHHCQIITTTSACVVEDLNSTNGIYVQGKRVRRHTFLDGDIVALGKHELVFIDVPASSASQTVQALHLLEQPEGEPSEADAEDQVVGEGEVINAQTEGEGKEHGAVPVKAEPEGPAKLALADDDPAGVRKPVTEFAADAKAPLASSEAEVASAPMVRASLNTAAAASNDPLEDAIEEEAIDQAMKKAVEEAVEEVMEGAMESRAAPLPKWLGGKLP